MSSIWDMVDDERRKWEKVNIDRVNHLGRACMMSRDYGGGHNKNSLFDALPIIAVVGDESSGKSSLLESIVGCDFLPKPSKPSGFIPRMAKRFGFVTRTPLVLHLERIPPNENMHVEFSHLPQRFFHDLSEIRQEIYNQINIISLEPNPSPFHILISSPYAVDDLTLIDLPALTNAKGVEKMVKTYINKPNCIILAVSPAGKDLAKSVAIKLAREVDPSGERTIGVLTKVDLMDKGTHALDVLEGDHRHPWVGVAKLPPHHDDIMMCQYSRPSREQLKVPDRVCSEVKAKLLLERLQKALVEGPLLLKETRALDVLEDPLVHPCECVGLANSTTLDTDIMMMHSRRRMEQEYFATSPQYTTSPLLDVLEDDHPCKCVGLANNPTLAPDIMMMYLRRRREQKYFATSPHYAHLADTMGSEYLAKLLSHRLESLIEAINIDSLINKGIDELEADPKHDRSLLALYKIAPIAQYRCL